MKKKERRPYSTYLESDVRSLIMTESNMYNISQVDIVNSKLAIPYNDKGKNRSIVEIETLKNEIKELKKEERNNNKKIIKYLEAMWIGLLIEETNLNARNAKSNEFLNTFKNRLKTDNFNSQDNNPRNKF